MAGLCFLFLFAVCRGQDSTSSTSGPLFFTADMNQHVVSEATPPGAVVYTLQASGSAGPDDMPRFFIRGTETFAVNETSGEVTLLDPLDREVRGMFRQRDCMQETVIEKKTSSPALFADERFYQAGRGRDTAERDGGNTHRSHRFR